MSRQITLTDGTVVEFRGGGSRIVRFANDQSDPIERRLRELETQQATLDAAIEELRDGRR